MGKVVYADHSATTYVKKEVLEEMLPFLKENYGNPSSNYSIGKTAKIAVERARKIIADKINAKESEIYFTSCGTEADNLAIKGIARANKYKGMHIITTKIEHSAVLESMKTLEKEGFLVTYLDVDKKGRINLESLKNAIREDTILISVMYANNEVGTVQEIEKIGAIAKNYGVIFHTDAVQAMPYLPIDVVKENIDALSISGHKLYAPKGVGALYIKENVKFIRIQDGGHQEKNKRSGTENVASIVGMGKAVSMLDLKESKKLLELREYFLDRIFKEIDGITLNGDRENRLPGNINISIDGTVSSDVLLKLDMKGIYVSAGSACNSLEKSTSHVLKAMGILNKDASSAIRITLGFENTKEDVDYIVENLKEIIEKLRK